MSEVKNNQETANNDEALAVRALIGKKVNVEISCYSFGFIYPDDNILVGFDGKKYIFKDSEDNLWTFSADSECSCEVSLA